MGYIFLVIALALAIYSAIASFLGARGASGRSLKSVRGSILAVFCLTTLALVFILYAFITNDFSLKIVGDHASRDLPAVYTLCALYADKAGSVFFWGWLVSLFAALLVWQTKREQRPAAFYTLGILGVIEAFFIFLVTLATNLFVRQSPLPANGFGLNPLLQNLGMLIHPPLLYLGFAAFSVVFALLMGALISRDASILKDVLVRRWTLFAWCALGIGNIVGMWWSYNELGWGGYWAWDPVENAGLMPWLLGTAFLHTMAISRRRKYLQIWSFCLLIFTFAFTLLSPFITHGGIESPLHGFYGSPLPPYILAAIIIVITGSMATVYLRRRDLRSEDNPASLISREGSFLLTDIILVVLTVVIFAGTVLPRVVEALGGAKIMLDRGFFDRTCGPLMIILVLLMGVCPLFGWGKSAWNSARRNTLCFLAVFAVAAAVILISGSGNWYIAAVAVGGLPLFVIFREWHRGTLARRRSRQENYPRALLSLINGNRARYGGFLAHIGIVLIALGIIVSSCYSVERTVTLDIGESTKLGKYELAYQGLVFQQNSVKTSAVASLLVSKQGKTVATLRPSYDYWFSHDDFFTEVAVRTTPAEDLFVSLVWTAFDPANKAATFRVLVNPLIVWIWVGGVFFLIGGAVSFASMEKQLPKGKG